MLTRRPTYRDALFLAGLIKAERNFHDVRADDGKFSDALWVGRHLAKRASDAPASAFARFDAAELAKADDEQRIVYGIASTPDVDNQPGVWEGQRYAGDVVETGAIEAALEDYLEYGNVREMHAAKAVGTIIKAEMVNGQLRIAVRVEDDDAWRKVKAGVYKGFSIGGRAVKAILARLADGRLVRRIKKLLLTEISLVDRPANPAARILLFKGVDMADEETTEERAPAVLDLAALAELAKAAPDPMKATAQLQAIRDELELSGDVEGAGLLTQAISLVLQAAGEAEPPADDTAEVEEDTEVDETEVEMAEELDEGDPAAIAMAARATIVKASRMRMGKRLPGMESIAKTILQLCADAGSEAASRALKAYGGEAAPVGKALTEADVAKLLDAALTKSLQPVAGAVLNLHERTARIEAQPAAGGPLTRITKRLGDEQQPATSAPDPATLAHLRRLAATESNPARREQYQTQLKQLEAAQR